MEIYNLIMPNESIDEEIVRKVKSIEWCQTVLNSINVDQPCFNTLIKLAYIIDFGSDKKIKCTAKEISEKWTEFYSQE